MLERESLLFAWVLDYTRKLANGIDDAQMTVQPAPGMNTPVWILGHLAIASDFAGMFLGLPMACPKVWHKIFGPGSDPSKVPTPHPTKAELLAQIEANHARVTEALRTATPEALAKPHTFAPTRDIFPTIADMLAHLMTTHPTLHLGQLSAWRRLHGLPAVLGF
jgi:hypothetical protein